MSEPFDCSCKLQGDHRPFVERRCTCACPLCSMLRRERERDPCARPGCGHPRSAHSDPEAGCEALPDLECECDGFLERPLSLETIRGELSIRARELIADHQIAIVVVLDRQTSSWSSENIDPSALPAVFRELADKIEASGKKGTPS